ncbi:sulfatase [Halobacteriales archaeon Cl-PHB]
MADHDSPNIILIVLDTVRSQQLSCYGHDIETMPALSAFAEDSTVFERAYTNAPWTLPAHASLFTGLLPSEHGCHGGTLEFDTSLPTLASRLQERGYNTLGVSNNIWVSDHFGLDTGFDTFYKQWQLFREARDLGHLLKSNRGGVRILASEFLRGNPLVNVLNGLYGKYLYRRSDFGGARTTSDLLSLIDGAEEPFFLFANYMEAHAPYQPHDSVDYPADLDKPFEYYTELSAQSHEYHTGRRDISTDEFAGLRTLYEGELTYLDQCLDRLFTGLKRRNLLSDSLVAVVGDHGENIGDHDLMAHRFSLHDTLLRVPLVVSYPGDRSPAGRHAKPVDLRSLHNELIEYGVGELNVPVLPQTDHNRQVVAEYLDPSYTPESRDEDFDFENSRFSRRYRAVVTADYKYVLSDRGEESAYMYRDGVTQELDVADVGGLESLRSACEPFDRYESGNQMSADTDVVEQHLSDLGYL